MRTKLVYSTSMSTKFSRVCIYACHIVQTTKYIQHAASNRPSVRACLAICCDIRGRTPVTAKFNQAARSTRYKQLQSNQELRQIPWVSEYTVQDLSIVSYRRTQLGVQLDFGLRLAY
jgi:hypothetical protein